jgi:hypothetical protein
MSTVTTTHSSPSAATHPSHRWVGYGAAPAGSIMETFLDQLKSHAPASTQYVSLADTTPAGVQEAYDVQYMTWFQFAATNVFAAVVSVAGRTMPTIYGPTFGAPDNTAGTFAALGNQLSDIAYPASVNQVGLNYQYLDMTVNLRAIFSSTGMVLLIYAFIPAIIVTAGRLVEDKRVKARETLKVMGCSDTAYLLANAIGATLRMAVGVALISVILAAFGAIPGSDIPVVMGISVMFAWTLIAYAQITPARDVDAHLGERHVHRPAGRRRRPERAEHRLVEAAADAHVPHLAHRVLLRRAAVAKQRLRGPARVPR